VATLLAMAAVVIAITTVVIVVMTPAVVFVDLLPLDRPFGTLVSDRAIVRGKLDQLLQLASVEPDALAVRADIDLHALLLGCSQLCVTYRTVHRNSSS